MNRKQKQADQIMNHGLRLKSLFVGDIAQPGGGIGPVTLCKALRRIETKGNRLATDYCNDSGFDLKKLTDHDARTIKKLRGLLPGLPTEAVHLNHDPRGYYLKIDSEYIRERCIEMYRDWGGYGILAPEFTGE